MNSKMFEADKISNYVPLDSSATKWMLQRNVADPSPKDFVPPGDRIPPDIFVTTAHATPKPEPKHPTVPIDNTLQPNTISTIPFTVMAYTNSVPSTYTPSSTPIPPILSSHDWPHLPTTTSASVPSPPTSLNVFPITHLPVIPMLHLRNSSSRLSCHLRTPSSSNIAGINNCPFLPPFIVATPNKDNTDARHHCQPHTMYSITK